MILTILFIESVVVKKINEALIPTAHIKLKQIRPLAKVKTTSI